MWQLHKDQWELVKDRVNYFIHKCGIYAKTLVVCVCVCVCVLVYLFRLTCPALSLAS